MSIYNLPVMTDSYGYIKKSREEKEKQIGGVDLAASFIIPNYD